MSELAGQDVLTRTPGAAAPRVMRVVLAGEIGRDEYGGVTAMLGRLLSSGVFQIVIDFSEVSHFDYRGVRPLLRVADAFRDAGGDVRLAGLSAYLFAIFRSAGADDAFDYFASVDDAVASFNRSIFAAGG